MAEIRFENVRKAYGDVEVVKGLDLHIKDGEFVVLVGPSGCGKSTTLRMIAGLETVSSGDLFIGEKRVNDLSPKDRDIAMVFQSYALYPHMSVRENMAFGLKVRKTAAAEITKAVDEVAELLGLNELLDRKPRQLSGGQRQRVAMGRAIVRRPQAFLFDEPLSNLDAKLRSDVRAEISRLRRRLGTTTVYVTHDQVEAMTLADRVVLLDAGIAQQIGPPMELFNKPANRFVAGFLGSPSMNFIEVSHVEKNHVNCFAGTLSIQAPAACTSFGLRPHQLLVGDQGVVFCSAEVDVIERLGAESFALCRSDGLNLTARIGEAMQVKAGDRVDLKIDPEGLHFFDSHGDRLELEQ